MGILQAEKVDGSGIAAVGMTPTGAINVNIASGAGGNAGLNLIEVLERGYPVAKNFKFDVLTASSSGLNVGIDIEAYQIITPVNGEVVVNINGDAISPATASGDAVNVQSGTIIPASTVSQIFRVKAQADSGTNKELCFKATTTNATILVNVWGRAAAI